MRFDARTGRRCCLAVSLRFRADQTTVRASRRRFADDGTDHPALSVEALPKSVDWVKAGAVTPIQTQGQCASDWYVRGSGRGSRGAALPTSGVPVLTVTSQGICLCWVNRGHSSDKD